MDKIATQAFANTIVPNAFVADLNRCIAYSSVSATSLIKIVPAYSGKYTNATNRLVLTSEIAAPSTPPITNQVQFKVRLLFSVSNTSRYSYYISIGNWEIKNSNSNTIESGSFSNTIYQLGTLPTYIIEGKTYYLIDLYISDYTYNNANNRPYSISINDPIFQYSSERNSINTGYTKVKNEGVSSLYILSDSTADNIKHLVIQCSESPF